MQVTNLPMNTTGVLYQNDSPTPLLVTVQAVGVWRRFIASVTIENRFPCDIGAFVTIQETIMTLKPIGPISNSGMKCLRNIKNTQGTCHSDR